MKATFENTVDILVKAYMNGTLEHGDCSACAVGNIVNHYNPISKEQADKMNDHEIGWNTVFCSFIGLPVFDGEEHRQEINTKKYSGIAKEQIDSTGYTWKQLSKIEWAFETAERNCQPDEGKNEEWMFNGLMAVVDVLADIHSIDLSQKEEAKLLFVKV